MKPTLSICIPTYKRSGYLKVALESIRIQLQESPSLQESVEVVVSDNCSTDDTGAVSKEFEPGIKNLKYVRSETNVGFDLNIVNVVKNASGTYCWYLGDDDVIVNGGLEIMCNYLKGDRYDFVGVNAKHLPIDGKYSTEKVIAKKPIISIDDFNEFYFKDYCQGGVSVLIFNREMWMSLVDATDFMKHWLYYETVLRILVKTKKPMAFIQDTLILTGQDCRWAENGSELFTFGNSNLLLERMILFGFDKQRIMDALVKNSQKTPIILLRAKGHGLKCNIENLEYIYKNLHHIKPFRLALVTIIYFVPNFIVRFVRDFKKFLTQKRASAN